MEPLSTLFGELLSDYTLRSVALGAILLGLCAGALGSFAVLRRQSLLGDAISHAALPGVAAAFLLTHSREPWILLTGALVSGWLGTLAVSLITRYSRLRSDAAMGIVLSVFFAAGMVLLTIIQGLPTASQAGLKSMLFGNASTLLARDVQAMALLCVLALAMLAMFWKQFKLITFDPDFAASIGLPLRLFDQLLTLLLSISIVIGLQMVGVVLMSALIIAPAAAARQWSNRLHVMVLLAAGFGALGGLSGALLSSRAERLPTGPAIVLIISSFVLISLIFAPARGILWDWLRHRGKHREVRVATVLIGMLRLAEDDPQPFRPHDIAALDAVGVHSAANTMPVLEQRGHVRREGRLWALTEQGHSEARRISLGRGSL